MLERFYMHGHYVVAFSMFLLYLVGAPPPRPITEPAPEEHW